MTARHVELARQISAVARDQGALADPSVIQTLLLVPGAPIGAEIMPFWRAVLGYEPRADSPDEDLVDPHGRSVSFWFETMDQPRPDGGGAMHVGVWVPPDQPRPALRPRSPPVAGWSAISSRHRGGRLPTPAATRPTSRLRSAAAEGRARANTTLVGRVARQ